MQEERGAEIQSPENLTVSHSFIGKYVVKVSTPQTIL